VNPSQVSDLRLQSLLTQRSPVLLPADISRRQAAVLLPLFRNASEYHVVFTKRTDTLKHHKGQIAFPGGAFEPTDGDLLATALRESYEEVGLQPSHVRILGRLDDLATFSTNYTISPFVGLIPYPYPFRPNPLEVAVIFDVPVSVLADPRVGRCYIRGRDDGATIEDYEYHIDGHVIWGATARIVRHFLALMNGE
jgi:8-oxo-dGTP pyrophosphatase MutT (NUDIX family)